MMSFGALVGNGLVFFFFFNFPGERARSRPREADFAASLLEAILYFTNTPTHSSTKYICG